MIDLTVNDVGLAIGDKAHVTGLRINFRDRNLRQLNGANITLWSPYEPATGLAVGGIGVGGGSQDVRAIVLAPIFFKIADDGQFHGGASCMARSWD